MAFWPSAECESSERGKLAIVLTGCLGWGKRRLQRAEGAAEGKAAAAATAQWSGRGPQALLKDWQALRCCLAAARGAEASAWAAESAARPLGGISGPVGVQKCKYEWFLCLIKAREAVARPMCALPPLR